MDNTYIIANWKMHGSHELAQTLCNSANASADILPSYIKQILCPPSTFLAEVRNLLKPAVELGAQNCHTEISGAYTGEISAEMLKEAHANYVIIGHSERRQYFGETNDVVKAKLTTARRAGLVPIVCIGESLEERKSGKAEQIVTKQMLECLPDAIDNMTGAQILLAYEPIWAIGSGLTPTALDIERMHKALHDALVSGYSKAFPIVYGGSVNDSNAREILAIPHVNGVLVGGASLKAEAFASIAKAATLATTN